MTGRTVEEWIGATPDTPIPPRVKLRIWTREEGRCYLTGRKIRPGDSYEFEHVLSLGNGGQNREQNIRLALTAPHKVKSKADAKTKAKTARIQAKHLGISPKPNGFRKGRFYRGVDGQVRERRT